MIRKFLASLYRQIAVFLAQLSDVYYGLARELDAPIAAGPISAGPENMAIAPLEWTAGRGELPTDDVQTATDPLIPGCTWMVARHDNTQSFDYFSLDAGGEPCEMGTGDTPDACKAKIERRRFEILFLSPPDVAGAVGDPSPMNSVGGASPATAASSTP